MAIYTGGYRQDTEARAAAKRIAKQQEKAQKGEGKRKKRSGLFGKVGGWLTGEALSSLGSMALMGLTGGAINPVTLKFITTGLKGAGMTLGKAGAHQATTGKWGKALKTSGQVDKIEAGGKYGYGLEEAKTLSEGLAQSRESTIGLDTLAADVTGSLVGEYGADFGKGIMKKTGLDKKLGNLQYALLPKTELSGEEMVDFDPFANLFGDRGRLDLPDLDISAGLEETIETNPIWEGREGGQVPSQQMDQNALIGLAILSQMQNDEKAYDNTPLEENSTQTISDYFASQGKTLGGSNIKSLSQRMN